MVVHTAKDWTAQISPEAWLKLSSTMGNFVNSLSDRDNLVVSVTPHVDEDGKKHVASAYYIPRNSSVYFDAAQFFTEKDAQDIPYLDMFYDEDKADYYGIAGAAAHEASHAAHTVLEYPQDASRDVIHWMTILEESRCEAQHLRRRPHDAGLLLGAVRHIVMPGLFDKSYNMSQMTVARAAELCGLILARVSTGVISGDIAAPLRKKVEEVLGQDVLIQLEAIWVEAQSVADADIASLQACAEAWIKALKDNGKNEQPDSGDESESGEQGESSSGEGSSGGQSSSGSSNESDTDKDGSGSSKGESSEDKDGSSENGESAEGDAKEGTTSYRLPCGSYTPGDNPEKSEEQSKGAENAQQQHDDKVVQSIFDSMEEEAKKKINEGDNGAGNISSDPDSERKKAEQERGEAQKVAQEVFTRSTATSTSPGWAYAVPSVSEQAPTAQDVSQARALANALKKAQYRDVSRTRVASLTPPGRLNIQQAAARSAQVATRQAITTTPWSQVRRREMERPPLRVGLSIDVSGSLNQWQRPISVMGWSIAQAVKAMDGTFASSVWNGKAYPLIAPNRFPSRIPVATTCGGSSGCAESITALEGALHLVDSDGVKVLVVLTDGEIHPTGIQKRIDRLAAANVQVLWVLLGGSRNSRTHFVPNNVTSVNVTDGSQFGRVIGEGLVEALKKHQMLL